MTHRDDGKPMSHGKFWPQNSQLTLQYILARNRAANVKN